MSRVGFGELLRYGLVTTARESFPVESPEVLRFVAGLGWRLERRLRPRRAAVMEEEARRRFGVSEVTAAAISREAHDTSLQARLEELLIPRAEARVLDAYVRVEGELPPRGLIGLCRAGNPLLAMAAIAWRRPGLVVVQRPPGEGARSGSGRRMGRAFESEQSRLPILWEADATAIPTHLAHGRTVVVCWDDRALSRMSPAPFLEGVARLSEIPWGHGPLTPAFIHRLPDKSWTLRLGPPEAERARMLREQAEPWLRAHPGQYLAFLTDCRMGIEPDPMFVEQA